MLVQLHLGAAVPRIIDLVDGHFQDVLPTADVCGFNHGRRGLSWAKAHRLHHVFLVYEHFQGATPVINHIAPQFVRELLRLASCLTYIDFWSVFHILHRL